MPTGNRDIEQGPGGARAIPFRKTHDLEASRDLVVPRFPDVADTIERLVPLTDRGHVLRYPDLGGEPVPSIEELGNVLKDIQRFADAAAELAAAG